MQTNQPLTDLIKDPKYAEQFKALFALMRASAVTKISWGFNGGGDSGDMDDEAEWEGLHEGAIDLDKILTDLVVDQYAGTIYSGGTVTKEYNPIQCKNLKELSKQMAGVVLDNDPHDWYNNDGGYGKIVFSFTLEDKNHIEVDMNINVTSSESYPSELEFDNG